MTPENQPTFSWQTFSIFLSSTFADMHAERDHLKNIVFPKLEEELIKRRINLSIVDLRWGVDASSIKDEEEREKKILKVCLDEIELCHPFFIGLLGDRYGWVPPEERMRQVSTGKKLILPDKGKSVTALEIEFGVLANPDQVKRSIFYFREPLDYSSVSPDKLALYSEKFNPNLTLEDKEQRRNSLEELKRAITDHFKKIGLPENVKSYFAQWDKDEQRVIGLEKWGEQVYKDALRECEKQAEDTWDILPKNWQEKERALLEAFIKNHCNTFCGRQLLLDELTSHLLARDNSPWGLVLTGESGSGKSAVFSKLYDAISKEDLFVLSHSAGISPRSKSILDLLLLWNNQLSEFLGIKIEEDGSIEGKKGLIELKMSAFSLSEEKKFGIEKIQDQFQEMLLLASQKKPIVLLIDALDRFEPTERAKYMTWLPPTLPASIRVFCTAITGTEQKAIEYHKGLQVRNIDQFSIDDAKEMLLSICARNHKEMNTAIVQSILEKERKDRLPASTNPLWLTLAAKLLLVLDQDDFEKIYLIEWDNKKLGKQGEAVLENYMKTLVEGYPSDAGELFLHLLSKAASVFGEQFTYFIFNFIACSRYGLREVDLEKLIKNIAQTPWDSLQFANLRRWFKGHLQEQGFNAQWNLNHSILRNTLIQSDSREKNKTIHKSMANYFQILSISDPLRISETMFHFMKAENIQETVDYYTSELSQEEGKASTRILADSIIEDKKGLESIFVMFETAKNEQFLSLFSLFVIELYNILESTGNLKSNLNMMDKLEEVIEQKLGNHIQSNELFAHVFSVFYIKLGSSYTEIGNLDKALHCFDQSFKLCKQLYSFKSQNEYFKQGISIANEKLGETHSKLGNLEIALSYFEVNLRISKELYDYSPHEDSYKNNLSIALGKMGEIYNKLDYSEKALEYFEDQLRLFKELCILNPQNDIFKYNLASAYEKIGETYSKLDDVQKTMNSYEESLQLSKQLYASNPENGAFKNAIAVLHFKLKGMYELLGNFEKALIFSEEGLRFAKELFESHPLSVEYKNGLACSYLSLGGVYASLDDLVKAINFNERGIELAKELYDSDIRNMEFKNNLGICYTLQGDAYIKWGDLEKALKNFEIGYRLFKEIYEAFPENITFKNRYVRINKALGKMHNSMGNFVKSIEYYEEEFRLSN